MALSQFKEKVVTQMDGRERAYSEESEQEPPYTVNEFEVCIENYNRISALPNNRTKYSMSAHYAFLLQRARLAAGLSTLKKSHVMV